ncbi:hypothetical protein X953_16580 [Virgibacillus sp. SK37]|nr:hypothetical protein X953_16580 [Virgibacillus sp. SK37]
MELSLEGDNHSTLLFRKFLIVFDKDLCPRDGLLSYRDGEDGEVICNIHSKVEEPGGNDVPWLVVRN